MKVPNAAKLVILLIACLAVWAWWNYKYPDGSWRYRMTVTVSTPEGLKTGSAVREVWINAAPGIEKSIGNYPKLRGEAVVVDLGKRGVFFALLCSEKGWEGWETNIVFNSFPVDIDNFADKIRYYTKLKEGHAVLPRRDYPKLSRFRDPSDRTSVQILDPDELDEVFGEGVELKNITIEMTTDPITKRIDQYLSKIDTEEKYNNYMKWFRGLQYGDPRRHLGRVYKLGEF